jgi:hypothetical protein
MTEFRFIADSRHAFRAYGLQILFVYGEIRTAKFTAVFTLLADSAAGGTSNYRGVVKSLLRYRNQLSANAVEFFTTSSPDSVILTLAAIAAHQNVHNRNRIESLGWILAITDPKPHGHRQSGSSDNQVRAA